MIAGDLEEVKRLHKSGVNVSDLDEMGKSLLHYAVISGLNNVELTQYIVDNIAKDRLSLKDKLGQTPMHVLCMYGGKNLLKIMKILLKAGANVEVTTNVSKRGRSLSTQGDFFS